MPPTKLAHVVYQTNRMAEMRDWYCAALGGLGAAALGKLADLTSIETVYQVTPFLLCLGLLTAFLPKHPGRPAHLL